ncbi:hypothetical protein [Roseibium algae]|uniref:DUF937 domain-containing protein n=1 Tax=Roseibium algae TaxID=3123038 RepID=A0ABU8THI2_9HYPH
MADIPDSPLPFDFAAVAKEMQQRFGWSEGDLGAAMSQLLPAAMSGARHFGGMGPDFQANTPGADVPFPFLSSFRSQTTPIQEDPMKGFFGTDAIRKAVAEQVASATGLQQDAVAEMMPVAATLAMGEIARPYLKGESLELMELFMRGFARGRPKPAPSAVDYIESYTNAMQSFWSGFSKSSAAMTSEPADEQAPSEVQSEELEKPNAASNSNEAQNGVSDLENTVASWMAAGRDFQSSQAKAFDSFFEKAVLDLNEPSSK